MGTANKILVGARELKPKERRFRHSRRPARAKSLAGTEATAEAAQPNSAAVTATHAAATYCLATPKCQDCPRRATMLWWE
jgi:hypothetical protein